MPAQRGQRVFGAGRFYGIQNTDYATPNPFLVAQDVSLEFKRDIKRLHGYDQLPVDVAAGMMTITGKVTNAVLAGRAFNDLMIGGTLSTGQIPYTAEETITITTGSTTGTAANGAGFVQDLGVYGATDGVPLVKVSTVAVLTADQYAVTSTSGVYTFSSLAARTSLKASYLYSTSGGQTVTMSNQPMGKTGNFEAVLGFLWGTEKSTIDLHNCMASDYSFATKLDDFMRPPFGFEAAAGDDGTLGTFSFAELS